jgi:hypothetical protein
VFVERVTAAGTTVVLVTDRVHLGWVERAADRAGFDREERGHRFPLSYFARAAWITKITRASP